MKLNPWGPSGHGDAIQVGLRGFLHYVIEIETSSMPDFLFLTLFTRNVFDIYSYVYWTYLLMLQDTKNFFK